MGGAVPLINVFMIISEFGILSQMIQPVKLEWLIMCRHAARF